MTASVQARVAKAGRYDLAINCDEFAELNLVAVTSINPRYIAGGALAPGFRSKMPPGSEPEHRIWM